MAYFLGRDVVVALTTEDTDTMIVSASNAAAAVAEGSYNSQTIIAGPMLDRNTGNDADGNAETIFGTQTANSKTYSNEVADLTGCDLSIGATDEDITYFGQRTTLKAEIKKETTLSLTRKKSDNSWDVCFQDARCGTDGGTAIRGTNDGAPDDVAYGYRAYVKMKDNTEVFVLRNCCITGHSVSLNADGTTEETLELMSYVDPVIKSADADLLSPTTATEL
jgi:hypothetical protein